MECLEEKVKQFSTDLQESLVLHRQSDRYTFIHHGGMTRLRDPV